MPDLDDHLMDDELFALAAGELDPVARERVQARIAANPALGARLAWYEAVCDGVTQSLPALQDLPSADEIVARARARPRSREAFFAWLAGPALRPAFALAAALIVGQGVIIGLLALQRDDTAGVRSVAPAAEAVVLVVAFDPQATEGAIRELILRAGARIIDGPKQLGEYRLAIPANRAAFAQSLLAQSKLVEYVRREER